MEVATVIELARALNDHWQDTGVVDMDEAEELLSLLIEVAPDIRERTRAIEEIISYAGNHDEWDEAVVASWPNEVISDLEGINDLEFTF